MEFRDSLRAAEDRDEWKGIVATSPVGPRRPLRLRDLDEMRWDDESYKIYRPSKLWRYLFLYSPEIKRFFPCSPKSKSWFSMFVVLQNRLCSPVPLILYLYSFSPEINVPFPTSPNHLGGPQYKSEFLLTAAYVSYSLFAQNINKAPFTHTGCFNMITGKIRTLYVLIIYSHCTRNVAVWKNQRNI